MNYNIKIDLGDLLNSIHSQIDTVVLPTVNQAVRAVASEGAYRWKSSVAKAPLWEGEKKAYQESISWRMVGDFSAEISSTYANAEPIETGRPQRDLKKMLDTSLKVRVVGKGKNAGKRYLIIPFRHNTPGNVAHGQDMPVAIHRLAQKLSVSKVTGSTYRQSGTGAYNVGNRQPIKVKQKTYSWGARLPAGLSPKLKESHAADPHAGMVRFKTSAGGANSSSYLTFRVMMEGSPGWIVPAKPGLYLAKNVADALQIEAPLVFAEALRHLK